ncbi:MAG TPA: translocation/assembly module TamB domain-containing protein, partial [Candidatus Synoicihabitans sp.]|nr:translocation/assembly module TamB domain-containing protein [Candidatus Synoicihabitans sp.]
LAWLEQPARFAARFAEDGWVPSEAELNAADWQVPAEALRLSPWFTEVRGYVELDWRQNRATLDAQLAAAPREGTDVPPLEVNLVAEGDASRVVVQQLRAVAPGVEATLDRPLEFSPRTPAAVAPATLRVQADLAQLPYGLGAGRVEGTVQVEPRSEDWPIVRAVAHVREASVGDWQDLSADARLTLKWPRFALESLTWRDAAGTEASVRASGDVVERRIQQATLTGRIAAATVARWLPEGVTFAPAELTAEFSGPLDQLEHEGRARVPRFEAPELQPMQLAVEWNGRGRTIEARMAAESERGVLQAAGQIRTSEAEVAELVVRHDGAAVMTLSEPTRVVWAPRWRVEHLRLRGPDVELAGELDDLSSGRVAVQAPRLDLRWLNDWWRGRIPVDTLRDLNVRGDVVGESLVFNAAGVAELGDAAGVSISLAFDVHGDADAVELRRIHTQVDGNPVVEVRGKLPWRVRAGDRLALELDPTGALELHGRVVPSEELWTEVARRTGLEVSGPRVEIDVQGRWGAPAGTARVAAEKIQLDRTRWPGQWPALTALRAELRGDGDNVRVETLAARVEGQLIEANGRLPLDLRDWDEIRASPWEYVRQHAVGTFAVPEADLAALAHLLPNVFAPTGRAQVQLEFPGDGAVQGNVRLSGAALRPIGPLGVLQEMGANLAFRGREVEIQNVEAKMGGQPVRLTGRATPPAASGTPEVELSLRGHNLPLVRERGLLLRGDLDLALKTEASGDGRVSGSVKLRDGLFLAELQDVIPRGGGNRPTARPPYFSVTIEPLHRWRLDVTMEGDRFLRLRTPLLDGTASARFQLTGTLGEPRAVGDATINEGRVRLPFATFGIEEGAVRLTQADPYQPQLSLIGTSRRLGYELRMELTGTASDPRLSFFSSPPLPSEDILLLVMAGQAPQAEVAYSGGQRAVQIGTFLGRGMIGGLFGSDGGERLTITTGEAISRQGRETYRFAYELTPRLSLVGEYDEFDSYNAGIRWRVVPRRDDDGGTDDDG